MTNMKLDGFLNEVKDDVDNLVRRSEKEEFASKEPERPIEVLVDDGTSFRARITKPMTISFDYDDLAEAFTRRTGHRINRSTAIDAFGAFMQVMMQSQKKKR